MNKPDIYLRRRIEVVAGLVALGIAILAVRAIDLQWLQNDRFTDLADKQRYRQYTVVAPRGNITDANGRILAESIEVPSIAAIADEVPAEQVGKIAAVLHLNKKRLQHKLAHHNGFVWLARQVAPSQAEQLMTLKISGIRQETEWRRYHPLGPETGHLIGFVGIDGKGLEGLERSLNSRLAGEEGLRQVQRDARGRSLPGGVWLREPVPGKPVRLTIDSTIQSIAYAALAEGIREQHAKGGSVIVMRPKDHALLAMVNWPGFNPNNYRHYKPADWRNRAVTDVFEPGSTMKPFTVAAALASGHWQPDSRIFCENGAMRVADHVIHDVHPEGWLDLTGLLARSSNIGAAKLALDIGPQPLHEMLSRAGFGHRSHIGISGESPGIMLPIDRWGPVETANIAFGQGVAVTPLQLATAFSILADHGEYAPPRIIADDTSEPTRQAMPPTIANEVLTMLEAATGPEGTGGKAVPAGYTVAGKTGTAQKPDKYGHYNKEKYIAVFAGIVPANNPQLVMVVVIDEPKGSIYGGQVSAPIFRKIAENALPYLGVTPHLENNAQWTTTPIAATEPDNIASTGVLTGLSLRETRRFASQRGLRLIVHGSGWVNRQSPKSFASLSEGDTAEVWLNE